MSKILLIAEHHEGALRKSTFQALTAARQLAQAQGASISIVLAGTGVSGLADELTAYGADKIYVIDAPGWESYLSQAWTDGLKQLIQAEGFTAVVSGAGSQGKGLLPRLAASQGWGMVADCLEIFSEDGAPLYKRPMYAGNIIATVRVNTSGVVVSARSSAFDAAEATGGASPVETYAVDSTSHGASFVGFEGVVSERPSLGEADRVVSGGRGLKEEWFTVMEPLADCLGAALGASRMAVDQGYCPNEFQVGQTGKVVAPDLYIAVALSGAIQHLAGMKNSKCIVAINQDEEAPIFQVSDYGLKADAFRAVPEFVEKVNNPAD